MATGIAATVAAPLVICRGENHQAFVEVKVAGPDLWPSDPTLLGPMKFHDALATDTGFVAQFSRHAGDEFVRNANRRTPARTFVGCRRAELTIIRPATQRTTLGRVVRRRTAGIMAVVGHGNQARFRRMTVSTPAPTNASESDVGSGTATIASISDLPLKTSMRTKLMLPSTTLLPKPSWAQEMS